MLSLLRDLRFAIRKFWRAPGLAMAAIATSNTESKLSACCCWPSPSVLLAVSFIAMAAPARRALRVDPIEALREE